jgi:hypothetical protein
MILFIGIGLFWAVIFWGIWKAANRTRGYHERKRDFVNPHLRHFERLNKRENPKHK